MVLVSGYFEFPEKHGVISLSSAVKVYGSWVPVLPHIDGFDCLRSF